MSQEERNTVAMILSSLVVIGLFGTLIWTRWEAGLFDAPDGLQRWARTVLWMIPAGVVGTIVLTILFTILYAIVTNDPSPEMVSDERDQAIGVLGLKVTLTVIAAGFIGAVIGLALGWTAVAGLTLILLGMALGDLFGNLAKLARYRAWL